MDTRARAETFTRYVGLELKGKITAHDTTALAVATKMGRSPAAFNRWLNGKSEIPLSVLCEACEVIGIEPGVIVGYAYDRMAVELGEIDGHTYDLEPMSAPSPTVTDLSDLATVHYLREEAPQDEKLAAKRGTRRADEEPYAE